MELKSTVFHRLLELIRRKVIISCVSEWNRRNCNAIVKAEIGRRLKIFSHELCSTFTELVIVQYVFDCFHMSLLILKLKFCSKANFP